MYLIADIGGTTTRMALSADGASFSELAVFATAQSFDEASERIRETAKTLLSGHQCLGGMFGVPGTLTLDARRLFRAPNLPAWEGKNLLGLVEQDIGAPLFLANDAALAALGEAHEGAGRGADTVMYITVGTGIGGARVVRGVIDGARSEPGHQLMWHDGTWRELEGLVSGSAILHRTGVAPSGVQNPELWQELSELFAYGLYNTMLHWSPDTIVLGGSVADRLDIDVMRATLGRINTMLPAVPPIARATLPYPGLTGALVHLRAQHT